MREIFGLFIIELRGKMLSKYNRKELVLILIVVSLISSILLVDNKIIGLVSFDIYNGDLGIQPVEEQRNESVEYGVSPVEEQISNETYFVPIEPGGPSVSNISKEQFGILPIYEESGPQKKKEDQFGIKPIENLSVQIGKEEGFGIMPIENLTNITYSPSMLGFKVQGNSESTSLNEWRMFKRNLNRTNYYPETINTKNFGLLWKYNIGSVIRSSPAVVNNTVYIGANDDTLYGLNASTGALIGGGIVLGDIRSSPAVTDGYIYFGSDDNYFYVINSTFNLIWSYNTGDDVGSSPAVEYGIAYMARCEDTNTNYFYSFNSSNGSVVWSNTTGYYYLPESSPAIVNGIVYMGSCERFYAYNATSGASIWEYDTYDDITSSPAVAYGLVFFAADDNFFALNATNGSLKWYGHITSNLASVYKLYSSPGIGKGIVYFGTDYGGFFAINASTGSQIWSYDPGAAVRGAIRSSPSVVGDIVFFGSYNDIFYALNATDGSVLWSYTAGNNVVSSAAVVNGIVYVGSDDGYVYAFAALPLLIENATWYNNLTGVYYSSTALGDVDNDGDLDSIIIGEDFTPNYYSKVYLNNRTSLVENVTWQSNLTRMSNGSLSFGDYNNDGKLDLAISGSDATNIYTYVYENNGSSFTTNNSYTLTSKLRGGSIEWEDLDNDGYLDLIVAGDDSVTNTYVKVYTNNKTGLTENSTWQQNLTGVSSYASMYFGDLDKNGYQDLVLIGDNISSSTVIAKVYLNNGTSLVENISWYNNLTTVSYGDIVLGDIDNDADLDLVLTGWDFWGGIETAKVYLNNGTSLVENAAWYNNLTGVYYSSTALGDVDNDGDLDLALTGFDLSAVAGIAKIYLNNGSAFVENTQWQSNLTDLYYSSISFGDIDNDTRLDLVATGYSLSKGALISKVYQNKDSTNNTKPIASTSFSSSYSNRKLTLSWEKGSDTETPANGLYYNLRVGTSSGGNNIVTGVFGGHGHPSGGYFGNMEQRRSISLNIPDQTYYWSIQTIDTGFRKSDWSSEQTYSPTVTTVTDKGGKRTTREPIVVEPPITPPHIEVPVSVPEEYRGSYWCGEQQGLSPEDIRTLIDLFGYVPCWVKVDKANITSKYKCNGIEFNINDIVGFSFSIYQNKPQYIIDLDYKPDKEKYCPWCYNKIQDYDETGVDCGGSCPLCTEKPIELWKCGKIPFVFILLLAILLAGCIYGYKKTEKYKYEFRIAISISVVALVSCIIFKILGICCYKYLALLYLLGVVFAIFILTKQIKFLKEFKIPSIKLPKFKVPEVKVKVHEVKVPEKKIPEIYETKAERLFKVPEKKELTLLQRDEIIKNSIIGFNVLIKKIKKHISKKEFDKAFADYNEAKNIYEYLYDKADVDELNNLYDILDKIYNLLVVSDLKTRLDTKLGRRKLRNKFDYRVEFPRTEIRASKKKTKKKSENELDRLHKLLEENKLDEAMDLYEKYYGIKFKEKRKSNA